MWILSPLKHLANIKLGAYAIMQIRILTVTLCLYDLVYVNTETRLQRIYRRIY